MPTNDILIILGVICIAVGFIAGALVAMLFADRDKKIHDSNVDVLPEGINRETYKPLLRLWRSPDGKLLVELAGRILTEVKQSSTAQRLELEAANEQWLTWLGLPHEERKVAAEPKLQPPVQPATRSEPILPRPAPESRPEVDVVAAITSPPVLKATGSVKSMVEQIDDILQELVSQSILSHRSVKITQDFRDGIVVWLDGGRYPGLDSVPDGEIRKLIRAAAAEWERRSERLK